MNDHLKGLLITTLGVLMVVPDSLFVRLIAGDPLAVTFWRGTVSGTLILIGLLVFQGTGGFRAAARTGLPGLVYVILLGLTGPGFVLAITMTSVANAVFIFSTIPVFSSIFSRIFLGEPISRRMVITMAFVMAGLAIIAYGSHENAISSWKGDAIAVMVSACFAGALTAVRKVRATSMIPAIPLAYLWSAGLMLFLTDPVAIWAGQGHLIFAHGAFIAVSTSLLTLGPRYISSAEVSLLILLESVLAPLLVWAAIGEDPGPLALVGGAVVIGALFVSNMLVLYRRRGKVA